MESLLQALDKIQTFKYSGKGSLYGWISRTLPSERRVLSTYSSEHPWMFTVTTGIRVSFGKSINKPWIS